MITAEGLRSAIQKQKLVLEQAEEDAYYKDQYGKGPWNKMARLQALLEFVELGAKPLPLRPGIFEINGLEVAVLRRRYRFPGKRRWYWYASPSSFMKQHGG